jgi:hypothetical protein
MKELLTTILCCFVLNAAAQYAPEDDFKQVFKQHMLTPTETNKPQLTFEQRDIIHHNIAGGILAAVSIPVLVSSILTFAEQGENQQLAATGLSFGGAAFIGSITLHSIGLKKLVQYHKQNKVVGDAYAE